MAKWARQLRFMGKIIGIRELGIFRNIFLAGAGASMTHTEAGTYIPPGTPLSGRDFALPKIGRPAAKSQRNEAVEGEFHEGVTFAVN